MIWLPLQMMGALFALSVVWTYYLAVMHLIENRDKLRGFAKWLAYIFVVPAGLLFDAFLNIIVCAIFWRIPRDKLTTGTLRRYMGDDSYRGKLSVAICTNLLNPFDPSGTHCR